MNGIYQMEAKIGGGSRDKRCRKSTLFPIKKKINKSQKLPDAYFFPHHSTSL